MILLLSFLVLVHEAGHFLAARALGMKVSKFGFGLPIGPTLWSKKVGDIEVVIHAFLLGGYVSFPDDEKDSDIPIDSMDRFMNRPVWQRMIVISAGVIANIITAFVFVLLTAFVWGKLPSGQYEVYVNKIAADKAEAVWESGLQSGDKIVSINGSDIKSNYALSLYSKNSKRNDGLVDENFVNENLIKLEKLNPTINAKDAITKNIEIKLPEKIDEPALVIDDGALKGYKLYKDTRAKLSDNQVKLRDSLKDKTTYVADGTTTLKDIAFAISDSQSPINMTIMRDNKLVKLSPIYANDKGLIGIVIEVKEILRATKSVPSAIGGTFSYLWDQTYMLIYGLCQLFTGGVPIKDLHGIVVITKIGGDVIQNNGFFSGLLLTAMISLDLALVNFLPIPALDGGHFMFLIVEKLRGKPLDEEALNKVSTFFFILLIILMVFVVFNDVYALIRHKF
jgi:regulator of sigma E protease